jgi:cytoskeletal protein CcmA (bactofilin family)
MEGSIAAEGDLTISGKFKGTIEIPSRQVVVQREGVVEADIKANQVLIQGTVRGNVKGIQRAALTSSADVVGKLETHELRVEEGAVFRGQVDILH